MQSIFINTIGWIGSVLVIGAYAANIRGFVKAEDKIYIWSNLVGGVLFVINTFYLKAFPSMVVNIVWVLIAIGSILGRKNK